MALALACSDGTGPADSADPCVPGTPPPDLVLAVGESLLLPDDKAHCLTIPAGDARYLLTAVHFGPGAPADGPFPGEVVTEIRFTAPGTEGLSVVRGTWLSAGRERPAPDIAALRQATISPAAVSGPMPRAAIQSALVQATVGQTVWIPDRWSDPSPCSISPQSIPVFPAVVVAIAGQSVILVDEREPTIDQLRSPAVASMMSTVAANLDAVYLGTMQTVISRTYAPPSGAGGRIFTLLTSITSSIGTSLLEAEASPASVCASSIETAIAIMPPRPLDATIAQFSGTALHEHAHAADRWAGGLLAGRFYGTNDWAREALATTAQEQAARLLANVRTNFTQSTTGADGLLAHWPATRWPGGARPEFLALYGPQVSSQAAYSTGGLLLLYAREQRGETWPDAPGQRLYESLAPAGDWSLAAVAAELDLEPRELMDDFALAVALDDRIEGPSSLPGFATWDNTWRRGDPPEDVWQWRAYENDLAPFSLARPLRVGAGAYGVWRVDAASESRTLEAIPGVAATTAVVRLTRYR